jgi:hypothetical protein
VFVVLRYKLNKVVGRLRKQWQLKEKGLSKIRGPRRGATPCHPIKLTTVILKLFYLSSTYRAPPDKSYTNLPARIAAEISS